MASGTPYSLLVLLCMVAAATAASYEDGDERLGYINIASDGTTAVTFNATSIQNAVILGLLLLVLGALILPMFGIPLGSLFSERSGQDYGSAYNSGYSETNFAYAPSVAKRYYIRCF